MDKTSEKLTVYFEEPFWVGLWERREAGRYQACRTVFGGEPTDGEVYEYVLRCCLCIAVCAL